MAVIGIKTLAQRIAEIRQRLLDLNGNSFSLSPGASVSDLFNVPQAVSDVRQNTMSYLNAIADAIPDILAVEQDPVTLALIAEAFNTTTNDILSQLSALIDDWGQNFDESRLPPEKASTVELYGTPDAPTQDLSVDIGKIVSSSGGFQYQTTAAVTMYSAQAGSYWDPNRLLFVIQVPIEAVEEGAAGNTPADTITVPTTSTQGFSFVTNPKAATGGRDLENDADFGARLLRKWQAIGRLTEAGVEESVIKAFPEVEDIYVAKGSDSLAVRGKGYTDVWIKGTTVAQITETFNSYNNPDFPGSVKPSKHPVLDIVSVDSGVAVLRKDGTSAIAGSAQAKDAIQFTTIPIFPVQVTYTYDSKIGDVQGVFNDPAKAPLNQEEVVDVITAIRAPILAKAGVPVEFDYTAVVMVVPGQDPTTTRANAAQAVTNFAANYKFEESSFVSDLDQIVEETAGILRISSVPLFAKAGQSGRADELKVAKNQYLVPRNINIF